MTAIVTVRLLALDETARAWPVMVQLRPLLSEDRLEEVVARMAESDGYRIAAAFDGETIVGLAGFRPMEMLYCGRILSIDDFVVDQAQRSSGVGHAMLEWIEAEARRDDRVEIHLQSARWRADAHRFYRREGFGDLALHFVRELPSD